MILDYMKKLKLSMKQIYKEVAMELNFIKCGDYYIPDIKLAKPNIRLGKWGADAQRVSAAGTPCHFLRYGTVRNAL